MANDIPKLEDFDKNRMRTTVHVHPDLYKALRIRLLSQGQSVVGWLKERMYDEVFADILAYQDEDAPDASPVAEVHSEE